MKSATDIGIDRMLSFTKKAGDQISSGELEAAQDSLRLVEATSTTVRSILISRLRRANAEAVK